MGTRCYRKKKTYLKQGLNTVSVSFLTRAVPQFSDNLLLFMRVEQGTFKVFQNEGQFYAYGASLVGDSGVPYAAIEDTIEYETYIVEDNIITILKIPEKNIILDSIIFDNYINIDDVEILIRRLKNDKDKIVLRYRVKGLVTIEMFDAKTGSWKTKFRKKIY